VSCDDDAGFVESSDTVMIAKLGDGDKGCVQMGKHMTTACCMWYARDGDGACVCCTDACVVGHVDENAIVCLYFVLTG